MSGPLTGLRFIEMVGLGPAPFAAMMLADQGAEVIRIARPGATAPLPGINTAKDVLSRNRATLEIDLKAPGGADLLLRLAGRADGLMEGFRPGVMERLGLGPEAALSANPRLVYGRMTGWGQEGPLSDTAGHDINYIGLTGVLDALGRPGQPPVPPLNLVGDFGGGGMLLAFGMLCGVIEASRSGRGQVVDAAMIDGASLLAGMIRSLRASGGWCDRPGRNHFDGGAPWYGSYECADGRCIAVGAIEPAFFAEFLTRLGLDPVEFADRETPETSVRLRARLEQTFRQFPRDHFTDLFSGSDACTTPVLDWDEARDHPHATARSAFFRIGDTDHPAPAPRFSRTPAATPVAAPDGPADPSWLLSKWGLNTDEIAGFRESGALNS